MSTPMVKYKEQVCDIATENLAFLYYISMSTATASLHQQNLSVTNGNIFVSVSSYCMYLLRFIVSGVP